MSARFAVVLLAITCGCTRPTPSLVTTTGKGADAIEAYFQADPDARTDEVDRYGSSALHIAVMHDDWRALLALLSHHPNLEQRDARNRTPLFLAAELGHIEAVGALLIAGSDPNATNGEPGETPLFVAAREAPIGVVASLLAHGADVHHRTAWGQTAIFEAARGKWIHSEELISILIAAGALVNISDRQGFTPLHVAAAHDEYQAVQLLLASGARAEAKSVIGNTPLDIALELHSDLAAEALFEAKAPRNRSVLPPPLFQFASSDDADGVLRILSYGFDPSLRIENKNALDAARASNAHDAISLLESRN